MKEDVIVIGGGPAGMQAAGFAAQRGKQTLLLDSMPKLGTKLRITGKGRCNITNNTPLPEFLRHFGSNGTFLRQAFSHYFTEDVIRLMESIGVATVVERGNRVFPQSGSAPALTDALVKWVRQCGVTVRNRTKVTGIRREGSAITALIIAHEDNGSLVMPIAPTTNIILATGGLSYPRTGSDGSGLSLAQNLGHSIVEPLPSLVPLETEAWQLIPLEGLHLKNVRAELWVDGNRVASDFGELEVRDKALAGPIILTLSGKAVQAWKEKRDVQLHIDLKPALEDTVLDERLRRELEQLGAQPLPALLRSLLPKQLIPFCARQLRLSSTLSCSQMKAEDRKRLRVWLKQVTFPITGHRDWAEAIVTHGGVHLREVDPYTMQSKLISNLFLAGEILDLDADTGGYNLQAAFSTGWLAGQSV